MNNSYENENQVVGDGYKPPPAPPVKTNAVYDHPPAQWQDVPATQDATIEQVLPVTQEATIEQMLSITQDSPVEQFTSATQYSTVEQVLPIAHEPPLISEPVVSPVQIEQPPVQASSETNERSVPEWSFRKRTGHIPVEVSEPTFREPTYRAHDTTAANIYTPGLNIYGYPNTHTHRHTAAFNSPEPPPKRKGRGLSFLKAMCLIIICALVSAGATYAVIEYRIIRADYSPQVNQVVLGGPVGGQNDGRPTRVVESGEGMSGSEIYRMALTQVVGISIDVPATNFFGNSGTNTAAGSGFIIRDDGYILTNHHVIEPSLQHNLPINVIFNDGSHYVAEVVGYEVANDVALLKIDTHGLNAATLAYFGSVEPGQRIYAIGNPLGSLHHTMTGGLVSAVGRTVTVEGTIINAFQFDAAVNRGNSGGPIYNEYGEVIGIVTAKLARSDVEGIGFAIPISDAYEIASGLMSYGYIPGRSLLGLIVETVDVGTSDLQDVLPSHAEYYNWVVGARVRTINPDSAAERAGLRVGDIIVGLGDQQVTCIDTLRFAMRSFRAGETTTMSVWRAGTVYELEVTFDEDLSAGQPERTAQVQLPDEDVGDNE